jgi:hypothetical protein
LKGKRVCVKKNYRKTKKSREVKGWMGNTDLEWRERKRWLKHTGERDRKRE